MKNKNDIQAMLKEAGILFAITLIAGLLLGFVYELTKAMAEILCCMWESVWMVRSMIFLF